MMYLPPDYLFDTNTYHFSVTGNESVVKKIQSIPQTQIYLSAIVVFEVLYNGWFAELTNIETGKSGSTREMVYTKIVESMADLSAFQIASYSDSAEAKFKEIYTKRANIDRNDWKIAAHALVTGMVVVTDNTNDFNRIAEYVPDLRFENWVDRGS